MKKNRKYFVVNSQEDEDGFTLYPENVFPSENVIKKQNINSGNYAVVAETGRTKMEFRKFLLLHPAKLNRMAEK